MHLAALSADEPLSPRRYRPLDIMTRASATPLNGLGSEAPMDREAAITLRADLCSLSA
jgi:hypothetical protein